MKLPSGALEVSSFMIISPAVAAKNTQRTLLWIGHWLGERALSRVYVFGNPSKWGIESTSFTDSARAGQIS